MDLVSALSHLGKWDKSPRKVSYFISFSFSYFQRWSSLLGQSISLYCRFRFHLFSSDGHRYLVRLFHFILFSLSLFALAATRKAMFLHRFCPTGFVPPVLSHWFCPTGFVPTVLSHRFCPIGFAPPVVTNSSSILSHQFCPTGFVPPVLSHGFCPYQFCFTGLTHLAKLFLKSYNLVAQSRISLGLDVGCRLFQDAFGDLLHQTRCASTTVPSFLLFPFGASKVQFLQ